VRTKNQSHYLSIWNLGGMWAWHLTSAFGLEWF